MKYIVGTQESCLTLKVEKKSRLKWYLDAALMVHSYFKTYTGATTTMGKVAIVSVSHKKTEHEKYHRSRIGSCG